MKSIRRWLLGVCLMTMAALATAEGALDGRLTIDSADARFNDGVVELNGQVTYPLTEQIRAALQDGITLTFELEVVISRPRRLWWNADVVTLDLRRDLSYHVISERYLLRGPTGAEQESFPTVTAALEALGKVERLPVAVDAQLRGDGPWEIAVRAGVRRGHIPDALRTLLFWRDDWHRTSEWHSWTLER
jgi:hypothetical protein